MNKYVVGILGLFLGGAIVYLIEQSNNLPELQSGIKNVLKKENNIDYSKNGIAIVTTKGSSTEFPIATFFAKWTFTQDYVILEANNSITTLNGRWISPNEFIEDHSGLQTHIIINNKEKFVLFDNEMQQKYYWE